MRPTSAISDNGSASGRFEYEAVNPAFEYVRGQVRATSKAEAKERIKAHRLRPTWVWPEGQAPVLIAVGKRLVGQSVGWITGRTRLPTYRVARDDGQTLVYSLRSVLLRVTGSVFLVAGAVVIGLYHAGRMPGIPMLLTWIVAVGLIVGGAALLTARLTLTVDRTTRTIVKEPSVLGLRRRQILETARARSISLALTYFPSENTNYYVVYLDSDDERIQIDASSSRLAELNLAHHMAEYLNLPFTDQTPS